MGIIKGCKGKTPQIGKDTYIADNAVIVGDVTIGEECSIWWSAVVRGDVNSISIGDKTNIQDGAVIHCTYQKASTTIGNKVSIGHKAIVHGCTIEDSALVGMGAIVMDNAVVQSGAMVAAGAVVLENTVVESGYIYAGVPAKKVKKIEGDFAEIFERTAKNYTLYKTWFEE
ncbi:gamma carbonic anhydrase family protein [Marivirga tractuosa]|uniref:Transferase hexapeptide repeat containing protein n=1 Tax=Marivirga tractuosa (strain ATCC 23168 / DSM 4126 / NBRC 15989 / NCIMB 1408 / VKM B-1430 / H-43) TaxID=643867 RepID=E4TS05_MARTH|nr:gamma carbonic anhydrase family protein [Marivirga tractuosa]ADR20756.1 transferase hexapeptide repeat containing protein [Marivirga tractuosa DSM 4126]BDD14793.1 gamma carbonic anhydrase family protein [Marivirga tractuosa]